MSDVRASKRQQELLHFVDNFIKGNGYGPSYREIMRALGYKSVSTVAIHIDALIAKGYVRKRDHSARSLEVISNSVPTARPSADTSSLAELLKRECTWRLKTAASTSNQKTIEEVTLLIKTMEMLGYSQQARACTSELESYDSI